MKPTRIDLTAQRFGRLVVIGFAKINNNNKATWECVCDCGNIKVVSSTHLRSGKVKSCGCLNAMLSSKRNKSHGESSKNITKEYRTWLNIKRRCYSQNCDRYFDYGGRGIVMCDRWKNSYEYFLEDVGRAPNDNFTLDRYPDKNGNYEPGNVRWATDLEQSNNKRNNHYIECGGDIHTLADWARILNIKYDTMKFYINIKKYSINQILYKKIFEAFNY